MSEKKNNKIIPIVFLISAGVSILGSYLYNRITNADIFSKLKNNSYITLETANDLFITQQEADDRYINESAFDDLVRQADERYVNENDYSSDKEDCVEKVSELETKLEDHEERITNLEERVTDVEILAQDNRDLIEHYHPEEHVDPVILEQTVLVDPIKIEPDTFVVTPQDPFVVPTQDNSDKYQQDLERLFDVKIDGTITITDLVTSIDYNNSHGTTQVTFNPNILQTYDIKEGILYTNGTYQESQRDVIDNLMFFTGGEDRSTLEAAVILQDTQGRNFLAFTSQPVEYTFPKADYISTAIENDLLNVATTSTLVDRIEVTGTDAFGGQIPIYSGKPGQIIDVPKPINIGIFDCVSYQTTAYDKQGNILEIERN